MLAKNVLFYRTKRLNYNYITNKYVYLQGRSLFKVIRKCFTLFPTLILQSVLIVRNFCPFVYSFALTELLACIFTILSGYFPAGAPPTSNGVASALSLIDEIAVFRVSPVGKIIIFVLWIQQTAEQRTKKLFHMHFKGATSSFLYFEKITWTFQHRHFQSVSIFSILSHLRYFSLKNPLVFFFLSNHNF